MANPSRNDKPHAEMGHAADVSHSNAVENLVIFAPLVLILSEIDYSSKWTVMACAVYFWSRVAHLIVYALGLPVFRTLAFTIGFFAQVVLVLGIFKIVVDSRPRSPRRVAGRASKASIRSLTETVRSAPARRFRAIRTSGSCSGSPARPSP